MNKLYTAFIVFMFFATTQMFAQQPVNGYARVSSIAGNTLTVVNCAEAFDSFEDGEYVIVMQMQDNILGNTTTTSSSFGDMTATPLSAGLYEVAIISSHTENAGFVPLTITLQSALAHTYNTGANSRVQVISYPVLGSPNYTSPAGGIVATPWDGNRGGVVAFWVQGTLTLGGNITADAVGFRGGVKNTPNGYSACEGTTYATTTATRYAGKGESIYLNTTAAYTGARGKILNGGGGGNDVNAGGGGGGNYSSGGNGGIGWTPAGTGCSPGVGGLGGLTLQPYISGARLFMGGGGGGGHENDGVGSIGANGGGIILLRANTITTVGSCALIISANGGTPANASNDGSGGAGAGGTVLLQVTTYSIAAGCPLTISSNGGSGGSSVTTGAHGGGGGGGQGAVIFSGAQPSTNVTTQTNAGAGGSSCIGCTAAQNGVGGTGPNNAGILTGNTNPLPIEFLLFTGHLNGNNVDLFWQTATEIDNDYFTVERRDELGNMSEIGQVDGAGTTTILRSYSLTDYAPRQGVNYYRLRQTDFNGTFSYSNWISFEFNFSGQVVSVYPNPTHGNFALELFGYENQLVTTTVTDVTGRIVSQSSQVIVQGNTTQQILLEGEPAGLYFVNISTGDHSEVIRIIRY